MDAPASVRAAWVRPVAEAERRRAATAAAAKSSYSAMARAVYSYVACSNLGSSAPLTPSPDSLLLLSGGGREGSLSSRTPPPAPLGCCSVADRSSLLRSRPCSEGFLGGSRGRVTRSLRFPCTRQPCGRRRREPGPGGRGSALAKALAPGPMLGPCCARPDWKRAKGASARLRGSSLASRPSAVPPSAEGLGVVVECSARDEGDTQRRLGRELVQGFFSRLDPAVWPPQPSRASRCDTSAVPVS